MKLRYFLIILLLCFALALQAEDLFSTPGGEPDRIDYIWWGTVSDNWNEAQNWSTYAVPNSTSDVIINAGCTFFPYTNTPGAGECSTLLIQTGAYLTVGYYNLTVYNDAHIHGQLNMNDIGVLRIGGSLYWEAGSTAAITGDNSFIYCTCDMIFQAGSDVQFDTGHVRFLFDANSYLYNYSPNTQFNDLESNKSLTHYFAIAAESTEDFTINGDLINYENSSSYCHYTGNIFVKGDVIDYSTDSTFGMRWHFGTLVLNGSATQYIEFSGPAYVNHLTIQSVAQTTLVNNPSSVLRVKGNLRICTGLFSASNNTVYLEGDWINESTPAVFNENNSTVVFMGAEDQYCNYSEIFYNLELDKAGGAFIVDNSSAVVECESYDWTAGTVKVMAGTFQANSLADNGISGSWHLTSSSGYIKLYNYSGRVDLNGDILIDYGYFYVYGGTEPSHWPFSHDASYTNTYGVLRFFDQGIVIQDHPSYALTIGYGYGDLGIAGDFICSRTDFDYHGRIEMVGSSNTDISVASGSSLSSLRIDKILASTVVTALTNLDIASFSLVEGTFVAPDTMYVGGSWYNYMGPDYFVEGTGTVVMGGSSSVQKINSSEHFHTLILNRDIMDYYYLNIDGASINVECENFIWQNGRIRVDAGSFTVNNLPQNSIQGGWLLYGGTINLHQPSGRNDLDGSIKIYGGEFNIYGSITLPTTYWCHNNDAEVYLSSGTLNYANQGVYIYDNPSYTLTTDIISGTFKINGSLLCDKTDFNPGTTVFEIEGNGNAAIDMMTGATLSNLVINKASAANTVSAFFDLVIDGDLTIQNGTLIAPSNISVSGTWDNQVGTAAFTEGTGTVVLFGNTSETCNEQNFYNLEINKSNDTVTLQNNLTLAGYLTIDDGRLDCNGNDLTCDGDINVNGTLELDAGVTLTILSGMHLTVNNGGRLEAIGTSTDPVTLTNSTGYTYYTIESGGTVAARYAIFEKPTNNGLYIKSGAWVDTQYALEKCTFRDGRPDRTLLRIDNDQDFAVKQAIFPTNTWGGGSNVMKSVNSGLVCFVNCTGGFAGEAYDADSYNRLLWLNNTSGLADLVIVKAEWSNPNPYVGETDTLTVSWINVASLYNIGSFTIGLYYNLANAPYPQQQPSQSITVGLPSGFPAGVIMQSIIPVTNTGSAGTWNSWLWIDRTFNITEADEDNNIFGPFNVTWENLDLPPITDLGIVHVTGTAQVQLDWTYPEACDRFNVYRSSEAYFVPDVSNLLDSVSYPSMQYIDTSAGDKYFYIVTAELD